MSTIKNDLLAEIATSGWADLLRGHSVAHEPLLQLMITPNSVFIKLSIHCLRVNVTDVLHLQTLFETMQFIEIFALQHLSNQEPVQVVGLE